MKTIQLLETKELLWILSTLKLFHTVRAVSENLRKIFTPPKNVYQNFLHHSTLLFLLWTHTALSIVLILAHEKGPHWG